MVKKRGLSDVVTTLMIVFLTIAALAVISPLFVSYVKNNLTKSTECLDYKEYFKFDNRFGYNCFRGNNTLVSIGAGGNEVSEQKIKGFRIVFSKDSVTKSVESNAGNVKLLNGSNGTVPLSGEVKTYNISLGESGFTSAGVYPILNSGRTCELSDSISLVGCFP